MPQDLPPQNATGLVDLSQSKFKDNIKATNWVYGNITSSAYRLKVFGETIKYNQTICPLERLYVNPLTKKCFDCPPELVFNLGERTCEECPSGQEFNLALEKCVPSCPSGEVLNTETLKCE